MEQNNKEGVLPMTTPPETGSLIKQLHLLLQPPKPQASVQSGGWLKQGAVGWEAATPKNIQTKRDPAKKVVIHHTAVPSSKDQAECLKQLKSIQKTHMNDREFDDIGYNFLVGGDGTVYEGRGWGVVGAHAKDNNDDSLGIAFMGNFNDEKPSAEAISAVKLLLQAGVSQRYLIKEFTLLAHRDLGSTECPGNNLYAVLSKLK